MTVLTATKLPAIYGFFSKSVAQAKYIFLFLYTIKKQFDYLSDLQKDSVRVVCECLLLTSTNNCFAATMLFCISTLYPSQLKSMKDMWQRGFNFSLCPFSLLIVFFEFTATTDFFAWLNFFRPLIASTYRSPVFRAIPAKPTFLHRSALCRSSS